MLDLRVFIFAVRPSAANLWYNIAVSVRDAQADLEETRHNAAKQSSREEKFGSVSL